MDEAIRALRASVKAQKESIASKQSKLNMARKDVEYLEDELQRAQIKLAEFEQALGVLETTKELMGGK